MSSRDLLLGSVFQLLPLHEVAVDAGRASKGRTTTTSVSASIGPLKWALVAATEFIPYSHPGIDVLLLVFAFFGVRVLETSRSWDLVHHGETKPLPNSEGRRVGLIDEVEYGSSVPAQRSEVQEAPPCQATEPETTVPVGDDEPGVAQVAGPAKVVWLDVVEAGQALLPVEGLEVAAAAQGVLDGQVNAVVGVLEARRQRGQEDADDEVVAEESAVKVCV